MSDDAPHDGTDANDDGTDTNDEPSADGDGADGTPPVACTLDEADAERRREWAESELLPLLSDLERDGETVTLTFDGAGETVRTVAAFVDEESDCCSFARYEIAIEPPYERTTLAVSGPEGTGELFEEGFVEAFDDAPAPS